jgi:hypothetical protein
MKTLEAMIKEVMLEEDTQVPHKVVNLLPYDVVVDTGVNTKVYPASGKVARMTPEPYVVNYIDGFEVCINYPGGETNNLPLEEEGGFNYQGSTIYIVSELILYICEDRPDLIAPDFASAKRDEKGHVISVPGFITC